MTRRLVITLATLIVGLSFAVYAQKPSPENPTQIVIRAARLLDVKSGSLINNAVVLIDGERITAVGIGLPIPSGAKVIDLGDVTLLPGLIDCHTHLLASIGDDYGAMLLTKSQAYRALEGASNARHTLRRVSRQCATSRAKGPVTPMSLSETRSTAGWLTDRA